MKTKAVLCRTNAPLYKLATVLTSHGIPVEMKSRDIIGTVNTMCSDIFGGFTTMSVDDLASKLTRKAKALKNATHFENMIKVDALETIWNIANSINSRIVSKDDILNSIEAIHNTDGSNGGVVLSTIHSSKGLEWDEVYVIRNDLIPHPNTEGSSAAIRLTEENLRYVAYTRAKELLYLDTSLTDGKPLMEVAPYAREFGPKSDVLKYSDDQVKIMDSFADNNDHMVIRARAGSGKTFILRELASIYDGPVNYIAYNKHVAESANMGSNVTATTMHSLLFKAIRKVYPNVRVDKYSLINKVRSMSKGSITNAECIVVTKLVSAAKNRMFQDRPDISDFDFIAALDVHFPNQEMQQIAANRAGLAREVYAASAPNPDIIEFDDMLWWPAQFGVGLDQLNLADVVMVDEVQDLNACQMEFLKYAVGSGSRVIAVGDPNQSIYYFRGAGHGSFDQVSDLIHEFGGGMHSIGESFRTSDRILDYVRKSTVVSDIHSNISGGQVVLGNDVLNMILGNKSAVDGTIVEVEGKSQVDVVSWENDGKRTNRTIGIAIDEAKGNPPA